VNRLVVATFILFSFSVVAKEKPGKTILTPSQDVLKLRPLPKKVELVDIGNDNFTLDHIVGVEGPQEISYSEVSGVQIIKRYPRLRGRLIEVFDRKTRSLLTSAYLRLDFVDREPLVFGYDFDLDSNDISKLRKDIDNTDKLNKRLTPIAYSLDKLYEQASKNGDVLENYPTNIIKAEVPSVLRTLFKQSKHKKSLEVLEENSSTRLFSVLDEVLESSRGRAYYKRSASRRRNYKRSPKQRAIALSKNAWAVETNLKLRQLLASPAEFRTFEIKDELCQIKPRPECLYKNLNTQETKDRISEITSLVDDANLKLEKLVRQIDQDHYEYLHKGQKQKLMAISEDFIALDNTLALLEISREIKEEQRSLLWGKFISTLSLTNDYKIIRFFEEGSENYTYPRFFIKNIINVLTNKIESGSLKSISLSRSELREFRKEFLDSDLEFAGNELGSGLVNALGQVFKKKSWVPYIRFATMFRKNFLTANREYVLENLLSEGGMEPGDIILEKDRQANTDVLIPGYWVHASVYLGTIKDMKHMGIWDSPEIATIRFEIEKYKTSKDRQHYLNDVWKNKRVWEDIPWFIESDRPGVGVHPLIKFLQTDGMAVLRPTKNWDLQAKKKLYAESNKRMYFQYDYVHNVKNQFSVSCSKLVLKVFDQVTFPVSKNLTYISVSPDQIGQPVSIDPLKPEQGELKLIMFFEAEKKGELTYDHRQPGHEAYERYLEASGVY
jgi:hypothetical protein